MRIDNKSLDALVQTPEAGAGETAATSRRTTSAIGGADAQSAASRFATLGATEDQVSLSNASNLVALAKGTVPTDRQAKINALTAQVRSGQYNPDLSEVSRAMVQRLSGSGGGLSS
jgi:anti-sigma28 factor (negative regulator of flagellin synthesis)